MFHYDHTNKEIRYHDSKENPGLTWKGCCTMRHTGIECPNGIKTTAVDAINITDGAGEVGVYGDIQLRSKTADAVKKRKIVYTEVDNFSTDVLAFENSKWSADVVTGTAPATLALAVDGVNKVEATPTHTTISSTAGMNLNFGGNGGHLNLVSSNPDGKCGVLITAATGSDLLGLCVENTYSIGKYISMGFDSSSNWGVIQGHEPGVNYHPVAVNPAGGDVLIGSSGAGLKTTVLTNMECLKDLTMSGTNSIIMNDTSYVSLGSGGVLHGNGKRVVKLLLTGTTTTGVGTTTLTWSGTSTHVLTSAGYITVGSVSHHIPFYDNSGPGPSFARLTFTQSAGTVLMTIIHSLDLDASAYLVWIDHEVV
jgi:hypothetical protein